MGFFKKINGKLFLTLKGKDAIAGYIFITPFLLGFIFLFGNLLIQSMMFSFSELEVTSGGFRLRNVGLSHYIRALTIDPAYNRLLFGSLGSMAYNVPMILIFSFFASTLLNQRFKGRGFARAVFFLPVILTSGIILNIENSDLIMQSMGGSGMMAEETSGFSGLFDLGSLLFSYTNIPESIIFFLVTAVNSIYDIVIASGVQILVFLAGLQSIPPSLYEASNIEGATGWENFWKITFPMLSPLILVNSLYTIIDSFTNAKNTIMVTIKDTIFTKVQYGYGSALTWIYFIVIAAILLIVGKIISKRVFYYD